MAKTPPMPTEGQKARLAELGFPRCYVVPERAGGRRYTAVAWPMGESRCTADTPRDAVQALIHLLERIAARQEIADEATEAIRTIDPDDAYIAMGVQPC